MGIGVNDFIFRECEKPNQLCTIILPPGYQPGDLQLSWLPGVEDSLVRVEDRLDRRRLPDAEATDKGQVIKYWTSDQKGALNLITKEGNAGPVNRSAGIFLPSAEDVWSFLPVENAKQFCSRPVEKFDLKDFKNLTAVAYTAHPLEFPFYRARDRLEPKIDKLMSDGKFAEAIKLVNKAPNLRRFRHFGVLLKTELLKDIARELIFKYGQYDLAESVVDKLADSSFNQVLYLRMGIAEGKGDIASYEKVFLAIEKQEQQSPTTRENWGGKSDFIGEAYKVALSLPEGPQRDAFIDRLKAKLCSSPIWEEQK
jgi:hypothetical protein